ncbi:MAG: iron ABC transporter permease [Firmicutes bacterium]|nr:iron ABC transporter permease [Bacillota bacterium]
MGSLGRLSSTAPWIPAGLALAAALAGSALVGPAGLSPGQVWHGLWHPSSIDGVILWRLRMPRELTAAAVGSALSLAGTVLQGVFHNPLADPYIVGAASGAAFGATLSLLVAPAAVAAFVLPVGAFLGALGAVAVALGVAARTLGRSTVTLLLVGYAVSVVLGAAISLLLLLDRQNLETIFFWELGSVATATWAGLVPALPLIALAAVVPFAYRWELDALLLGEADAASLGVDVARVRLLLLASASLLTAAAVALAGIIGFVGLVAPHAVRRLVGAGHRRLVPAASLAGAAFLVAADTAARSIPVLGEVPIGVVTALTGGPLFVYLLVTRPVAAGRS